MKIYEFMVIFNDRSNDRQIFISADSLYQAIQLLANERELNGYVDFICRQVIDNSKIIYISAPLGQIKSGCLSFMSN